MQRSKSKFGHVCVPVFGLCKNNKKKKKKILFNSRYKFYLRYYYTIYNDIILFGKNKYKVDTIVV